MPSDYTLIDLSFQGDAGALIPIPDTIVKVYDATNMVELDDLETDGEGHIPAGTLDVDAGTTVRFRVENYLGLAVSIEQVTT